AAGGDAQAVGKILGVLGGVTQVDGLATVLRHADDNCPEMRSFYRRLARRGEDALQASAAEIALGVVRDDFDAVFFAGFNPRIVGQIQLEPEVVGVGIGATARPCVRGLFLTVDEDDNAADATAAVGQRYVELRLVRVL